MRIDSECVCVFIKQNSNQTPTEMLMLQIVQPGSVIKRGTAKIQADQGQGNKITDPDPSVSPQTNSVAMLPMDTLCYHIPPLAPLSEIP